jgi:hypothetical protein
MCYGVLILYAYMYQVSQVHVERNISSRKETKASMASTKHTSSKHTSSKSTHLQKKHIFKRNTSSKHIFETQIFKNILLTNKTKIMFATTLQIRM